MRESGREGVSDKCAIYLFVRLDTQALAHLLAENSVTKRCSRYQPSNGITSLKASLRNLRGRGLTRSTVADPP